MYIINYRGHDRQLSTIIVNTAAAQVIGRRWIVAKHIAVYKFLLHNQINELVNYYSKYKCNLSLLKMLT